METLYHGSFKDFNNFEIAKELAVHNESVLMEGYAIYLTESKEFAKNYGCFVYEAKIDSPLTDFTKIETLANIIGLINQELANHSIELDINDYININSMFNGILNNQLSITSLDREISLMLESDENFYMNYQEYITEEEDCLFELISKTYQKHLGDFVKYYDKQFLSNIYIFRNPNTVQQIAIQKVIG